MVTVRESRNKQVCVQPPPPAVNVTLPALAAERRAASQLLLSTGACCTAPAAVDGYLLPARRSAANPLRVSMGHTDGRMDRRTLDRYIDSTYYAGSVSNRL